MKRIQKKNINSPEEYNRIFKENKELYSTFDFNRWNEMLKYFRGGSLVDLGCFNSFLTKIAKDKYKDSDIWGIDYADAVIAYMQKQFPNIHFMENDIYNLKLKNSSFNYATAGELIEHLENPRLFIKEAMRILKPGGVLAISTPLEETGIGEIDKDRHLWSFSKQDIFDLLKPYGIVHFKIMRSERYPVYKYHFPIIVVFCQKYAE